MLFLQENLHLQEAWDVLAAFITPTRCLSSTFTGDCCSGSKGHGYQNCGEKGTNGQSTGADGVKAGPKEWSVMSDVVFCGQNTNRMPSGNQIGCMSATGSFVGSSSGCGEKSIRGKCGGDEIKIGAGRISNNTSTHRLILAEPKKQDIVSPSVKGLMGCRLQEGGGLSYSSEAGDVRPLQVNNEIDHASNGPNRLVRATSCVDVDCSYSDDDHEKNCVTQEVLVPVRWLLAQALGDSSSAKAFNYKNHCEIGQEAASPLHSLQNYLVQLLENERSKLCL
jgi:hypothetical protein